MARPLSARVNSLRNKAKKRKNITYGQLVKVYRRGQGAYLSSGSDQRHLWQHGLWKGVNGCTGSRKHDTAKERKQEEDEQTKNNK